MAGKADKIRARKALLKAQTKRASKYVKGGPIVQKAVEYAANAAIDAIMSDNTSSGGSLSLASARGSSKDLFSSSSKRGKSSSSASTQTKRKMPRTIGMSRKGSKKWMSGSTGFYKGSFKRPRQTSQPKVETLCLAKGFHCTKEYFGKIEDPHTVYLHHSTFEIDLYARSICAALIRKLFKKAGITVEDRSRELNLSNVANSSGFRIVFVTQNPVGGNVSNLDYDTKDNYSLSDLITDWPAFTDYFKDYIKAASVDDVPMQLILYDRRNNGAGTDAFRIAANMYLNHEYLDLYSQSKLIVQNRTAGDGATTTEEKAQLDRIDNQPLQGYIYEYKNADPRLNIVGTTGESFDNMGLNYTTGSGLLLLRAATLGSSGSAPNVFVQYEEPPVPKTWANIAKSSKILLQPGTMKKTYISHKFSGKIVNVMKALRVEYHTGTAYAGVKGKSQIIALEEKLRTTSTNPVTVMYECEKKIGAVFKTRGKVPFITELTTQNVNNLPA